MFYVYILLCKDTSLYVGSTNNLEKRLKEHNTSKNGAHYTKIRRPVTLQYHEQCETYSQVRAREAASLDYLYSQHRAKYLYREGCKRKT